RPGGNGLYPVQDRPELAHAPPRNQPGRRHHGAAHARHRQIKASDGVFAALQVLGNLLPAAQHTLLRHPWRDAMAHRARSTRGRSGSTTVSPAITTAAEKRSYVSRSAWMPQRYAKVKNAAYTGWGT